MEAWWKKVRLMHDINKERYFYSQDALADELRWEPHHGSPPLYLSLGVFYFVIQMLGTDDQQK
jgi:hypothetical protein